MAFRYGETETVAANRAAFLTDAGIDPARTVVMQVEHGERVERVGEAACGAGALDPDSLVAAEVLMTNEPGVALFGLKKLSGGFLVLSKQ